MVDLNRLASNSGERLEAADNLVNRDVMDLNAGITGYFQLPAFNLAETKFNFTPQVEAVPALVDTSIQHVDPALTLLNRHLALFNRARERISDDKGDNDPGALLQAFADKWKDDEDVRELLKGYVDFDTEDDPAAPGGIRLLPARLVRQPQLTDKDLKITEGARKDSDSSAFFKLSRFAMDDFHRLSGQRTALNRLKRLKAIELSRSRRQSDRLEREIRNARVEYANLDRQRLAAEEDYALARGLLDEQLAAVDGAFAERQRLLSNPVALCYVRVNDLPVSISHRSSDLVPATRPGRLPTACDGAGELPECLQPFLELLADQPMSAWKALADDWRRLPSDLLYQPPAPQLPGYLAGMQALPAALRVLQASLPPPTVRRIAYPGAAERRLSHAAAARRAADRVTLEQLTGVRRADLRIEARRLQDDLGRALACLLHLLAALPAADRFAWSRLAEDDRLLVHRPESWPGFVRHRSGSAGLRLALVVNWLHEQLADEAPAESRTALRTALRACLLHAVNDDPAELLRGRVVQFPGRWGPGAVLGATLNRPPALHAPLKVYDAGRRLIGEARVVDSQAPSGNGLEVQVQVEVVRTLITAAVDSGGWTLVGRDG